MSEPTKVHTSALCWVPPISQQKPIQCLRAEHDRQIHRWPPHVNVLYPFVPFSEFDPAARLLAHVLQYVQPFSVTLRRLESFKHGKKSQTAWLVPESHDEAVDVNPWYALQNACESAFPHCIEQRKHGGIFTPHLTVGQFQETKHVDALHARVNTMWDPLTCTVDSLVLISRSGQDEPFLVHWRVPLGGGCALREPPTRGIWLPDMSVPEGMSPPTSTEDTASPATYKN